MPQSQLSDQYQEWTLLVVDLLAILLSPSLPMISFCIIYPN